MWLNPPYGPEIWRWLDKLANHGNGVALLFARTETRGFFRTVWGKADALLFIKGRLTFHRADGTPAPANGGAPSVLAAYGAENATALRNCTIPGQYVEIPK